MNLKVNAKIIVCKTQKKMNKCSGVKSGIFEM